MRSRFGTTMSCFFLPVILPTDYCRHWRLRPPVFLILVFISGKAYRTLRSVIGVERKRVPLPLDLYFWSLAFSLESPKTPNMKLPPLEHSKVYGSIVERLD